MRVTYGDGADDRGPFYQKLYERGIQAIISRRRDGRLQNLDRKPWFRDRNDAIRAITGLGKDDEARKLWKTLAGYHRHSIGEKAMSRFKRIFGGEFRGRELKKQKAELYAKSIALNKMTRLGMPKSEWVAA